MKIRINRLLSEAGLGSRREVEDYIRQGRVELNGKRATLTDVVGAEDTVLLDGVDLPTRELVQEHISLDKVATHVRSKNERRETRTRGRAAERAESQRLQHAPKSAALRKTSKNNPENKRRHRAETLAQEETMTLGEGTPSGARAVRGKGARK